MLLEIPRSFDHPADAGRVQFPMASEVTLEIINQSGASLKPILVDSDKNSRVLFAPDVGETFRNDESVVLKIINKPSEDLESDTECRMIFEIMGHNFPLFQIFLNVSQTGRHIFKYAVDQVWSPYRLENLSDPTDGRYVIRLYEAEVTGQRTVSGIRARPQYV